MFIFPFLLRQLEQFSSFTTQSSSFAIPLPNVVIATDATPTHWTFYFQGSGLPFLVSGAWSSSLCRAHIAL